MEDALAKELESKINFNTKRELQEYRPELGFKAYTEVFTVLTPEFIFKVLCGACQTAVPGFTVSEDTYKVKTNLKNILLKSIVQIKGKVNTDDGTCSLNIVLSKVDDSTTCIEFHKTNVRKYHFDPISNQLVRAI